MDKQVLITMSVEEFRSIIQEEVEAAVADLGSRRDLPHFLTRKEAKELLRINDTKMSELMGIPDFPVCREFGVKIYTDKLFEWIEDNMQGS